LGCSRSRRSRQAPHEIVRPFAFSFRIGLLWDVLEAVGPDRLRTRPIFVPNVQSPLGCSRSRRSRQAPHEIVRPFCFSFRIGLLWDVLEAVGPDRLRTRPIFVPNVQSPLGCSRSRRSRQAPHEIVRPFRFSFRIGLLWDVLEAVGPDRLRTRPIFVPNVQSPCLLATSMAHVQLVSKPSLVA
jgi:hypothetical protein